MKKTPERPRGEPDYFGENLPTEWYTFHRHLDQAHYEMRTKKKWQPSERTKYVYDLIQSHEYDKTDACKRAYATLATKGINRQSITHQKWLMFQDGLITEAEVHGPLSIKGIGDEGKLFVGGSYEEAAVDPEYMRIQCAYMIAGEVHQIARSLPEKNTVAQFAPNYINQRIRNLLNAFTMEELVAAAAAMRDHKPTEDVMYNSYDYYYVSYARLNPDYHRLEYYMGHNWKSVGHVELYLAQLLTVLAYAKTHNP